MHLYPHLDSVLYMAMTPKKYAVDSTRNSMGCPDLVTRARLANTQAKQHSIGRVCSLQRCTRTVRKVKVAAELAGRRSLRRTFGALSLVPSQGRHAMPASWRPPQIPIALPPSF